MARPSLRKAESTRVRGSAPRPSLANQGKAASVSERLGSAPPRGGPALPRASSVISTAEGPSRRTSIHDFMAKDPRPPVSVDPSPAAAGAREYPSAPPPAPPACPPLPEEAGPALSPALSPALGSLLGSCFMDSVFMDTIFSDAPVPCAGRGHAFLSLNPSLVSNISGPPPRPAPWPAHAGPEAHGKPGPPQPNGPPPEHTAGSDIAAAAGQVTAELPALSSEDKQSLWFEYGCV